MSNGKKVLNVFGIIFAWLLSITLVLLLFVSPIFMSALSVVQPKNLKDTVLDIELPQLVDAMTEGTVDAEDEQLSAFLSTNAVQELYEVYVGSIFGALDSDLPQVALTEEKVKEIIHNNIDELYEVVKKESAEFANMPEEAGKQAVEAMLNEGVKELTSQLPSAEELLEGLEEDESGLEEVIDVLGEVDTIKLSFVVVLVVLSGLIFVCRLPGLRGFRWLSVDLFVATGFSALICVGLSMGTSVIEAMVEGTPVAELFVGKMLTSFVNGVYIRTAVMLIAAIALLVVYLLIKKYRSKKSAAAIASPVEVAAPAIEAPVAVTEENAEAVEETAVEETAEENPAEVDV